MPIWKTSKGKINFPSKVCVNWIENFGHGHIDFSLAKILMTGLIVEALVTAIVLYIATQLLWRWSVLRSWNRRKNQRPL